MKAIDCYWQDWAIRIGMPELTFYCEDDNVSKYVDKIKNDASPTKIEVKEIHQSHAQSAIYMKVE